MADTAVSEVIPTKKPRNNSRKALKQKNPSSNEANILAQQQQTLPPQPSGDDDDSGSAVKENHESLSQPCSSRKKSKPRANPKKQAAGPTSSFEKEMQEMQEMMEKLRIEKVKTEEMLKEKDEMLKQKEEELEVKGREHEKLQGELKKLQKIKEFKPTMTFPMVQSGREKEHEKERKKGCPERKRPSPPYILWCKDQWNEIKKDNPEAEFKEISNILGTKWKSVTAEEKKPYEEKYQTEKAAYLQIIAKEKREAEAMKLLEEEHKQRTAMDLLDQYLQFKQEAEKKENKKTKKEKDPLKPKQPMSAFFLFSNERRAALLAESKTVLEVAKITGEEWKNMSEKKRRPYEEMAKKNKEKYMEEMEGYKQKKQEEAENVRKEEEEQMKLQKQEALQLLKKKEKTENIIKKTKQNRQKKKNADPNKPKKPASSFIFFSKEARKRLMEERPGTANSTLNALISVKWKEMGDEEKGIWNVRAAEAKAAYQKELEECNKKAAAAAAAATVDELE
ncbi:high mobility group B protein 6 [Rhodamnia argentea]|uniref:High mobility group B protein 6 n=1 Tax=Rhodamnia argentea TaxID=178133 RepID=A0A8B8QR61_9MYRT|nr:high mobility group B protein 6 [Rhodamnia argentea]